MDVGNGECNSEEICAECYDKWYDYDLMIFIDGRLALTVGASN